MIFTNQPDWYDVNPISLANLAIKTVPQVDAPPLEVVQLDVIDSHLTFDGWFHLVFLPALVVAILVFQLGRCLERFLISPAVVKDADVSAVTVGEK